MTFYTTSTSNTVCRDGRNSARRLEAARKSCELAKRRVQQRAQLNAWKVLRMVTTANVVNGGTWGQILPGYNGLPGYDLVGCVMDFLGVSEITLADDTYVNVFAETLWSRISFHCHAKCKDHFIQYGDATYASYWNPNMNVRCICCALSLGCEHTMQTLTQQECRKRNIPHYGMCYSVSECTKCGEITAVDSSD
jgi:hypothetical protein